MKARYSEAELSEIVQMALSDHVSFKDISAQYGLAEKDVVKLMRENLKKGSYRAWRKSCLLYTSPSPRDLSTSRMPSSA